MKAISCALVLYASLGASLVNGDTFGSGANSFNIDFVTIGNPGNVADTTGDPNPVGSVPYTYRMGKYEISTQMVTTASLLGNLGIFQGNNSPNQPATDISWFEAARFVNWLNSSTGRTPAYKFDTLGVFELWEPGDVGYNPDNPYRNSLAKYVLPNTDEWYKAAYFNPVNSTWYNYPNGRNTPPTAVSSGTAANTAVYNRGISGDPADITSAGGLSPYGTMAQGGNAREWEESDTDLNERGDRGGSYNSVSAQLASNFRIEIFPSFENQYSGFRVASVPEPRGLLIASVGVAVLALRRNLLS